MSASFPQMAFWVIFPLAVLIVLSGWIMILISAVKKLRSRKTQVENNSASQSTTRDQVPPQPEWSRADLFPMDGIPPVPIQ
jgi:hypothetical protein